MQLQIFLLFSLPPSSRLPLPDFLFVYLFTYLFIYSFEFLKSYLVGRERGEEGRGGASTVVFFLCFVLVLDFVFVFLTCLVYFLVDVIRAIRGGFQKPRHVL